MTLVATTVLPLILLAPLCLLANQGRASSGSQAPAASPTGGCSDDPDHASRLAALQERTRRELHRVGAGRLPLPTQRALTHVRRIRHVRARGSDGMAQAPPGPDPDRDGWRRLGSAMGRSSRGDPARRRRRDPAGSETLARSDGHNGHDAYRHSGAARRQDRRLDGEGQRRTIPLRIECRMRARGVISAARSAGSCSPRCRTGRPWKSPAGEVSPFTRPAGSARTASGRSGC